MSAAAASSALPSLSAVPAEDRPALEAVVRDLCPKKLALLGEATHGDGHTEAFKVALVQQLVTRCDYGAVVFEASFYEFVPITRARREGRPVAPDMVAAAVGGQWRHDREFAPLLAFLATEVNRGRIWVGGFDYQLSGRGQPYANDILPAELMSVLDEGRRSQCQEALRQRIYGDYGTDEYRKAQQSELLQCLDQVLGALDAAPETDAVRQREQRQMAANIREVIKADFEDQVARDLTRDRVMFDNARWLMQRWPRKTKTVFWGATAHMAKAVPATPPASPSANFGSLVHQAYRRNAFALGFSARTGSYRWSRDTNKPLPTPPAGSLESSSTATTTYLSPADLRLRGKASSAVLGHEYQIANWADMLDGIVIFQSENPPVKAQ